MPKILSTHYECKTLNFLIHQSRLEILYSMLLFLKSFFFPHLWHCFFFTLPTKPSLPFASSTLSWPLLISPTEHDPTIRSKSSFKPKHYPTAYQTKKGCNQWMHHKAQIKIKGKNISKNDACHMPQSSKLIRSKTCWNYCMIDH